MTSEYAAPDADVVDYQIFCLDPELRDRQTGRGLLLRGPAPRVLEPGQYFVCLGAAQTFGRFCAEPFPTLLQQRLGMPTVNFGRGGAGPAFFASDNDKLLEYVNRARFIVVQVMAGRSEGNSLFESKGLGYYIRRADGTGIDCDQAFRELLTTHDAAYVRTIVAETRQNWVESYRRLLNAIRVPKVLFWFSSRQPEYTEDYRDVSTLFGEFPQLVNADMIRQVRGECDDYVECVSSAGLPHTLISRSTGKPTVITDPWGGTWHNNWYYPSPKMHAQAADALAPVCRKYARPVATRRATLSRAARRRLVSALRKLFGGRDDS